MDVKDYFTPFAEHKLWWEKTVLSKMQPNRRINVYYSPNASGLHYFFISQLWFLSKLSDLGNIHYYIVINDQLFDTAKNQLTKESSKSEKLNETAAMLSYFGVDPKNIHCYFSSDCVNKLFSTSSKAPFVFSKSLRSISPKMLNIPKTNIEYEYLDPKTNYPLSYYLPKVMDLFISQNLHLFYPEDIDDQVDVFVSSWFGMPLITKLYSIFTEKGLITDLKPILVSTKRIPFFGHNKKYYPRHIVPSTKMSIEDIYESILIYNVKAKHMEQLLTDILIPNLGGKFIISKSPQEILKSDNLTDFKKLSFEKKALSLAYSFFEFFKKINESTTNTPPHNYLSIKNNEDLEILKSLFRSPLTLSVLKNCNGKTISEISKKLDKHQPNISKIVSNLKKTGLILIDNKGRLSVQINTIKIDLRELLKN